MARYTFFRDARGQRPFVAYAPVQTDKTKEALVELDKELRGIIEDKPIQPDELSRAQASLTLTLPGSWETMGALADAIGEIVTFGLDDRYYDTFAEKVRSPDGREPHRRGRRRGAPRPAGLGRGG